MTDQRLRHLERDAAHGDLKAQARLLLERVRVGDLTKERLRLAAHLGHEAARLAVGDVAPNPDVFDALHVSGDLGLLCVVACVAADAVLVAVRAKGGTVRHEPAVTVALHAARSWSACPCTLHLDACEASLVQGLRGLSEEAVRRHVVDAISLVIRGQLPFGHRIHAPPFSRGDGVLDAVKEVRWLVSTATELCGREVMRSALAEAFLPALLAPRGFSP